MGLKIIETNQHYMKSSTDFLKNTQNSSLVSYYAIDKSSCKQVYNAVCIFLRRFEITLPRTYYVFPTFFLLCQPIVLLLGLTGFENHRSQLKPLYIPFPHHHQWDYVTQLTDSIFSRLHRSEPYSSSKYSVDAVALAWNDEFQEKHDPPRVKRFERFDWCV